MAVLADKKTVGAGFSNAGELVKVKYDFSVDGGSVADYDVLEASSAVIVEHLYTDVEAAVTTATDLDLDLGKGAGGAEFHSDVAPAALTLDAIIPGGSTRCVELAAGEKIVMGIETGAATAGKLEFVFMVYKR